MSAYLTPPKAPAAMAEDSIPFEATHNVYNITELMERILLELPPLDLLNALRVSKHVRSVIIECPKSFNKISSCDGDGPKTTTQVFLSPALFSKPEKPRGLRKKDLLTGLKWRQAPKMECLASGTIVRGAIDTSRIDLDRHDIATLGSLRKMHLYSPQLEGSVTFGFNFSNAPEYPTEWCFSSSAAGMHVTMASLRSAHWEAFGEAEMEFEGLPGKVEWTGEIQILFPRGVGVVLEKGEWDWDESLGVDGLQGMFEEVKMVE